jgi:amino acid transporter
MRRSTEAVFYMSIGAGMALGTVAFTMVAGLFEVVALPWAVLALLIAAALCSAIALSVGELASMWPSAPAIWTYFKMAFGKRTALTLVFLYLIFIIMIGGVESYLFALVMRAMLPVLSPLPTIVVLIAGVVVANLYGLDLPRSLQIITTCGCIAVIVAMAVIGANMGHEPLGGGMNAHQGLAALPSAVGIAVFLFMGFEWLTTAGIRPEAYRRMVPWSMLGTIVILLLTYSLFSLGLSAMLPRSRLMGEPVPQVPFFISMLGPIGAIVAGGLSLSAIVSTFNAGIIGGARLLSGLAREKALPAWVGSMNLDTGAPAGAVLLLGSLAVTSSILVLSLDLYLMFALIGSAIICSIYGAYMLAVIRLRRTRPDHRRPFRTPLPRVVQQAMVALVPLFGLATLLSIPELGLGAVAGFIGSMILAVSMGEWSRRRMSDVDTAVHPPSAPRAHG